MRRSFITAHNVWSPKWSPSLSAMQQQQIRVRGLLPGWLRAAIRVDAEVQIAAMAGAEFFLGRSAYDGAAGRQCRHAAVAGRIGDFPERARRDDRTRRCAEGGGSDRNRGSRNSRDRNQLRRVMSDSIHINILPSGEDAPP